MEVTKYKYYDTVLKGVRFFRYLYFTRVFHFLTLVTFTPYVYINTYISTFLCVGKKLLVTFVFEMKQNVPGRLLLSPGQIILF